MKTFLVLAITLAPGAWAAPDAPVVFRGTEFSGKTCSLTVYNAQNTGAEGGWESFHVVSGTPWQAPGSAPLDAHQSPTRWSLYAKSATNSDQIALEFAFTPEPSLDGLQSFTFETRDAQKKRFQAHCQNLKRE